MSSLINRLVQQFRSKSQYDHFIQEYQEKFDINTYRFQQMTPSMARKSYNQLKQKYEQSLLPNIPRNWHQNQRKIFVWFLIAYLKYLNDNHMKIIQHWQELSETFFNKDILFLKYQYSTIQKIKKRKQWTERQDDILRSCEEHISNANWNEIAKQIFFQTQGQSYKSSKQCRQRWQNHLDHKIKKETWQVQEDLTILRYVLQNGKKWSKIVQALNNTRTEHMVKNRFKSLLIKGENQLKRQKKQYNTENDLIQQIISLITQKKPAIQQHPKSSIDAEQQVKDLIAQELPEIKLNGHKKSFGILARGQNGEFVNDNSSVRSSQHPFNIFQCQSPATLSLGSSAFIFSSSYSSYTPPSVNSNENLNNLTFSAFQQRWKNKVQQKGSINSDVGSNRTTNFIQCSRREENLRFSFEFDSLQNNGEFKGINNEFLSTPIMKAIENHLLSSTTPVNPLQTSEYYMSTLDSSFVLSKQYQQKQQILKNQQKNQQKNKEVE